MSLEEKFVDYSYDSKHIKKQRVKEESDLEYMNSVSAAVLLKSSIKSRALLWFGFVIIIWAITWAYYAEIDSLTRGEGKVVPSHEIQVIQNLEGGIVSEILVEAGDFDDLGGLVVLPLEEEVQGAFTGGALVTGVAQKISEVNVDFVVHIGGEVRRGDQVLAGVGLLVVDSARIRA